MSRKKKQKLPERYSFVDDNGQRWLQCKYCYEYVKVDEGTGAITCSSCTLKRALVLKPMDKFFASQKPKTGRPAGWHFMNEFVDKDGNVFHKGKEQPKIKGTLEPTVNAFEKKIGLYTEPDTTNTEPPFYVPPLENDDENK